MAEGLARDAFGDKAHIFSAGSAPADVNPYAVQVMDEIGIDISGQYSKSVDDIDISRMDFIITLCADEICPVIPKHVQHLHWPLPDPANDKPDTPEVQILSDFRLARDDISAKITNFMQKTLPSKQSRH